MDGHPVYTIPNHHPTKMDALSKTFVQIILAAKWLVRHSSTSPSTTSDDICLLFCLNPSSMYAHSAKKPKCLCCDVSDQGRRGISMTIRPTAWICLKDRWPRHPPPPKLGGSASINQTFQNSFKRGRQSQDSGPVDSLYSMFVGSVSCTAFETF